MNRKDLLIDWLIFSSGDLPSEAPPADVEFFIGTQIVSDNGADLMRALKDEEQQVKERQFVS